MMRPALCKAQFHSLLLFGLLKNPFASPLAIFCLQIHLPSYLHVGCHLYSTERFRSFHVIGSNFQARFSICLRWPFLSWVYALGLACATGFIPEFPLPNQLLQFSLSFRIILSSSFSFKPTSCFLPSDTFTAFLSILAFSSAGWSRFNKPPKGLRYIALPRGTS